MNSTTETLSVCLIFSSLLRRRIDYYTNDHWLWKKSSLTSLHFMSKIRRYTSRHVWVLSSHDEFLVIKQPVFTAHVVYVAVFISFILKDVSWRCQAVFPTLLLEWNPLERLDCSRNPHSDIRVCSITNGQKQHFSVLSNLHEKSPIDTDVCV